MRILFVLEHYYPYVGGAETLFRSLAESLAAAGHQVEVLTTRLGSDLDAREVHNGVRIRRLNCRNRFLFTLCSIPWVIRYAGRADLVHTTPYSAAFPAWIGAKIRGKKLVVTWHEVWGKLWLKLPYLSKVFARIFYTYEQFLLRLGYDRFVAVSEATKRSLLEAGIAQNRIVQIYNGLDYTKFEGYIHQPSAQFTYAYFGRLGVSKGLDLLLPAATRFAKIYPDSKLILIVPRRPVRMYANIQTLIAKLNLQDHIQLLHDLSDEELYQQISQVSCVVIPSYSEGFCFVATEAVGLGVPIISSGRTALKETVQGRYLEMEEQTEEALYDCLVAARVGAFEERPVKRFELGDAVKAYMRLYEEL
ncbi:MAG: glycosyltransferase family 4 protein [Bacteroidota bacterium]